MCLCFTVDRLLLTTVSSRLNIGRGVALGAACVAAVLSIFVATLTNRSGSEIGVAQSTTVAASTEVFPIVP